MALSEQQIALRQSGIGSSEIAALVGLDPYKTPMQLWLRKTGKEPDMAQSDAAHFGDVLEPVIAAEFATRNGVTVSKVDRTYVHAVYPFAMATPDFAIAEDQEAWLEVKAPGFRQAHLWGHTRDAESIPEQYFTQVQWQLVVTVRSRWRLAALIGGQDYREFEGESDQEIGDGLLDVAGNFMRKHVLADIPPELDATAETRRWLASRYTKITGKIRQASGPEQDLLEQYAQARRDEKAAKARKEIAASGLMLSIADDDGFEGDMGKATYRFRKAYPVPARIQATTRVLTVKARSDKEEETENG